eukprot:jgi/Orpsp1_1/1183988/evm.model.c7180000087531.1
MKEHDLNNNNSQIYITSIIGRQSTGKSTLLNLLFNTKFETMENDIKKTTQGILISFVENSKILVLDNEGIDGYDNSKDKTGDKLKLERKLALFSIYISDVIMINIFEKDVNTIDGLNIPLFEKVFEVLLKKDKEQEQYQENNNNKNKKLLLFIIRDFSNTVSLDKLESTIIKQYEDMWNKIKPINFKYEFKDYFYIECESLSQKPGILPNEEDIYYKDKLILWKAKEKLFNREINELKKRFFESENENYIYKNISKNNKKIYYNDFSEYTEFYWNNIKNNHDLNASLLFQLDITYNFNRNIKNCYDNFENIIETYSQKIKNNERITENRQYFENIKNEAIENIEYFEKKASENNKSSALEYNKTKDEWINKLNSCINNFYSLINSKFMEKYNNMNKELENEIKIRNYYNKIREGEIITKKELDELKNEYKKKYENGLSIFKEFISDYIDKEINFENKINSIYKLQLDKFKSNTKNLYNSLSEIIQENINGLIMKNNRDEIISEFWDGLADKLKEITFNATSTYEQLSMKYDFEIDYKKELDQIKNDSFDKFIKRYKKELLNINSYLIERFENKYCKLYKFSSLTEKNAIEKSLKEAKEIINLLNETKFSNNKYNIISKDIK